MYAGDRAAGEEHAKNASEALRNLSWYHAAVVDVKSEENSAIASRTEA